MKIYFGSDAGGGRSDGSKKASSSTGTKVKPAGKLGGGKKNTPMRTKKPKR